MRLLILSTIIAALAVAAPAADAAAQKSKKKGKDEFLGRFGDWEAHKARISGEPVCYIASLPKKSEGKYKRRDETSVLVSHWPRRKVWGQVEVRAGYTYKKSSSVLFKFKTDEEKLWTTRDTAWARNSKQDSSIVKELKAGLTLRVIGYSWRGTRTEDTYSLKGFTKAYETIDKECRK